VIDEVNAAEQAHSAPLRSTPEHCHHLTSPHALSMPALSGARSLRPHDQLFFLTVGLYVDLSSPHRCAYIHKTFIKHQHSHRIQKQGQPHNYKLMRSA
jgi:hypothetical protein